MKQLLLTESQFKRLVEISSSAIDAEAKNVNLNPTEPQKEAGNYRMAHVSVKGMPISIENPKGSIRTFKNSDGSIGGIVMKNHYGYFKKTSGNGKDGDAVDVFLGPNPENFEYVYVVDQNTKEGDFDESKVMIGFNSKEEAKKAYMSNYSPGWTGFRNITGVSLRLFKKWLYRGNKQRKPFADYVEIQKKKLEENKLNEDVFANTKKIKKNSIGLTYNKHTARNKNNFSSFDMINTDKMDESNEDTYEVTLKGGITSYNITSINGEEVMHYFKRKFLKNNEKTTIKNAGKEYELFMEDNEFRNFLNVFENKVNRVINYCINKFNTQAPNFKPNKVSIYPVPSSSNFNTEMAKIMSKMTLCNLPVQTINTDLLVKDLKNIQKDEDFINKNKEYFNGPMFKANDDKQFNGSVETFVEKDINKFNALKKAQEYIVAMNEAEKNLLSSWYLFKNTNKQSYLNCMVRAYKKYFDALMSIRNISYSNPLNPGSECNFNLNTITKSLKYTKGPSVKNRSAEIWALLKPYFRGKKSEVSGTPYTPVDIFQWEKTKFEIKNLTNGERMGIKNYYSQNENPELVKQELEKIKGGVFVIFDDNISGGATLSDICYQCKNMGVEYLIPITFGKMDEKWSLNRIPLSKPENKKGENGFNF